MTAARLFQAGGRALFVALWLIAITLALYAAARFRYTADWTATGRNSLSAPSRAIVKALRGPVDIIVFAHGARPRRALAALITKYRRVDPAIHLRFINPDRHPALVRRLGIRFNGEIEVRYQGRQALVLSPTETGVTNELASLERTGVRRLTFFVGNEERKIDDGSVLGLSVWGRQLRARGFHVTTFNPGAGKPWPLHPGIVVLADPRVPFLPGELTHLQAFIKGGGDLLVLLEPGDHAGLAPLLAPLGLHVRRGFVVDPASSLLTGASPAFIAVHQYPNRGPARGLRLVTVFPTVSALRIGQEGAYRVRPVLTTGNDAWTQIAPLQGLVAPPAGVKPTVLTLGAGIEAKTGGAQRIVVLGDTDFLSNSYIGEGGNLALAMNLANWMAHDEAFINLPNRASPDLTLTLTSGEEDVIALGFLVALPLALLGGGVATWWRRRRL